MDVASRTCTNLRVNLKTEAACISETFVNVYRDSRRPIQEQRNVCSHDENSFNSRVCCLIPVAEEKAFVTYFKFYPGVCL
jgi:hypothetical protein